MQGPSTQQTDRTALCLQGAAGCLLHLLLHVCVWGAVCCGQITIVSNIDTKLAHVPEAIISFVLKVGFKPEV